MVQNNADKLNATNVINLCNLRWYLKNYNDGTHYSDEEMKEIYDKLINAQSNISNREHIRNIEQTQIDIRRCICPRCGGALVERTGKYGKFWGCSNYPKCRFKVNDR